MKKPNTRVLAVCLTIVLLCAAALSCKQDIMSDKLIVKPVAQMIPSEVQWTDSFDDDNVSDWQFIGANMTTEPGVEVPANYSVSSSSLWFQGPNWNFVIHNSSVAYGTWTFSVSSSTTSSMG